MRPRIVKKYNCIYCGKRFYRPNGLSIHLNSHCEIDELNRNNWFNSYIKLVQNEENIKAEKELKKKLSEAFKSNNISFDTELTSIKKIVHNTISEFGISIKEAASIKSIQNKEQLYIFLNSSHKFNAKVLLPPIVKQKKKNKPSSKIRLTKDSFHEYKLLYIKQLKSEEKPDAKYIIEVKNTTSSKALKKLMRNNMGKHLDDKSNKRSPFISTPMGGMPGYKRK